MVVVLKIPPEIDFRKHRMNHEILTILWMDEFHEKTIVFVTLLKNVKLFETNGGI